jgi:antitoxin component of RelBE/YafQ-DinJ toxin-antitoxin module
MEKDVGYSLRIDKELREAFVATCKRLDVPGGQLIRGWMREFVKQNAQQELPLKGGKR